MKTIFFSRFAIEKWKEVGEKSTSVGNVFDVFLARSTNDEIKNWNKKKQKNRKWRDKPMDEKFKLNRLKIIVCKDRLPMEWESYLNEWRRRRCWVGECVESKELKTMESLFNYLPMPKDVQSKHACRLAARTQTDGTFRTTAEKVSFPFIFKLLRGQKFVPLRQIGHRPNFHRLKCSLILFLVRCFWCSRPIK